MEQQHLTSSKQQQRPTPLRLAVNAAPFPRPNWPLEDWPAQNSPHPYHLQHHHATISNSSYGADLSNLDELAWHPMASQSPDEAELGMGPLPERPSEPNCGFYMRTGHCGYGMNCRYNHPPNRNLAAALARDKGEYPERAGQPECQYYLKTGTCKFGITCKFHHPKDRGGYVGSTALNALGFPLRPGEKDCAYYMRTGSCKFGATCKFNHPQTAAFRALVAMSGSSMYPSNGSSTVASPHPFQGLPSWPVARTPYAPRSRFQAPSTFAPLIVQAQNMVSMPGWGTYQARMGPQQPVLGGASFVYGAGSLNEAPSGGIHTTYTPYVPGSAAAGFTPAMQSTFVSNDSTFPERPGQPECQYYMKTGDCKYGMACRYHHPKDRVSFIPNCVLNPRGLPIRQGAEKCTFYMQYGTCKFGHSCKFDHPTSHIAYSPSASSLTDFPVGPYPVALPVAVPIQVNDSSTIQGPVLFNKRLGPAASDMQQGYKDPFPDGSAGESSMASNNARLSSASSNGSSNAETVEMRADSTKDASNSPL